MGWCCEHGAAFVPFAPLGRGFLTGTVTSSQFAADDWRDSPARFQPEALATNLHLVEIVRQVADHHQATPAQVAIAWTLAQGEHVIPVPGTKNPRYLADNAPAADLDLTAADLAVPPARRGAPQEDRHLPMSFTAGV